MWFIAELIQRYTTSVAKTFIRLASVEAEANRRALENMKSRREAEKAAKQAGVAEEPAASPPPAAQRVQSTPAVKPVAAAEPAPAPAPPSAPSVAEQTLSIIAKDREAGKDGAEKAPAPEVKAQPEPAPGATIATPMPMGVRADVVARWLGALSQAERKDIPALLEKMRKDKKVRVPELQIICAEALGEPPQHRKKAEHLAVLKTHFFPTERPRSTDSEERIHAS